MRSFMRGFVRGARLAFLAFLAICLLVVVAVGVAVFPAALVVRGVLCGWEWSRMVGESTGEELDALTRRLDG